MFACFEQPEHQQLIIDAGALPLLVDLLKRHKKSSSSRAVISVVRRAADAITNLAHENSSIKTFVRFSCLLSYLPPKLDCLELCLTMICCFHFFKPRIEGGIPPLVELLEYTDLKVQRAAAGALRTLAFKNDENKNQVSDIPL